MLKDIGVLPDSIRFYHEADAFTENNLFHIPHAGIYHCDGQYVFSRTGVDICQLILIDAGALTVEYQGQTLTAQSGMIVLLDCRKPHRYYAVCEDLRMRWFQFVGASSFAYTELLIQTQSCVLRTAARIAEIEASCDRIMTTVQQGQANAHVVSVELHKLLALLTVAAGSKEKSELEQSIQRTVDYMESNYGEANITIAALAKMAALSECYYVRKFKQYQSVTPHQALQAIRLRMAKHKLSTSSQSVEEIAAQCGFCNTSHLIMAFRKATGVTPLQFRTMWK